MVGNFFVGDFQNGSSLQLGFFQQKGGQSLVEAFPHNLLHEPHYLGKAAADQLIGIVGHNGGLLHHCFEQAGRENPECTVLFCFHNDFKLNIGHNAGCGEQADIPLKQSVQRNLPAFAGKGVHPQLTGTDYQQPKAIQIAVVQDGTGFDTALFGSAEQ